MTTTEKLQAIKARCEALLETASKRTPGEWEIGDRRCKTPIQCEHKHIAMVNYYKCGQPAHDVYGDEHEANAAFIASCAGPAEAGWRATIAAIDALQELSVLGSYVNFLPSKTLDEIITAWEGLI